MLSLTPEAINDWLLRRPGGRHALERGLASDIMPEALLALERLTAALDDANQNNPEQLEERLADPAFLMLLRTLAFHLGVARRLRLIWWIEETGLANVDQVLQALIDPQAPPAGSGPVLHADMTRQYRLGLLDVIFDPERIRRVQAACRSEIG